MCRVIVRQRTNQKVEEEEEDKYTKQNVLSIRTFNGKDIESELYLLKGIAPNKGIITTKPYKDNDVTAWILDSKLRYIFTFTFGVWYFENGPKTHVGMTPQIMGLQSLIFELIALKSLMCCNACIFT